jgi:hypothetical protein
MSVSRGNRTRGTNRRGGRPRTRPPALVGLRCDVTPTERRLVRAGCRALGLSQSAFVRRAVVEAARRAVGQAGG